MNVFRKLFGGSGRVGAGSSRRAGGLRLSPLVEALGPLAPPSQTGLVGVVVQPLADVGLADAGAAPAPTTSPSDPGKIEPSDQVDVEL
jgi:hypothetical protein